MGDRSGSREPKGASLKKSKKNPGASAAKAKKLSLKALGITAGPVASLPPPLPMNTQGSFFDCGVALLSRQFDRDRDRVLQRAQFEGQCIGMLHWFADIEKQSVVADLSKTNSGFVYFAAGVHPDNVDRTNKKSHDEWLEKVEELGKKAECLALVTGLNLGREMGTHFSQESLLKSTVALAEKLQLPIVLHSADPKSLERAMELLVPEEGDEEGGTEGPTVIVHDALTCTGADLALRDRLVQSTNFYFIISGAGLADPDEMIQKRARAFVEGLPVDRILFATDSPWRTPQNLPDTYLRTLRNEPANLPWVAEAVAEVFGVDKQELAKLVRDTTLRLFGMEHVQVSADSVQLAKTINAQFSIDDVAKTLNKTSIAPKADSASADTNDHEQKEESSKKEPAPVNELADYRCTKCRSCLFKPKDITTHSLGATKTVFKVGEEGLCASFIFVPAQDGREIHKRLGLSIRGGNAECTTCGTKLGKYSPGEAVCPCGALVNGPVVKINAAKTDFSDNTLDTKELAERARIENEDSMRQAEIDEMEMEARLQAQGGRVKKTKKHKSENKGNFSNFRNKSFVPNAARVVKDENKEDTKKKTSKHRGDSEDEEENPNEEEAEQHDSENGESDHSDEEADQ